MPTNTVSHGSDNRSYPRGRSRRTWPEDDDRMNSHQKKHLHSRACVAACHIPASLHKSSGHNRNAMLLIPWGRRSWPCDCGALTCLEEKRKDSQIVSRSRRSEETWEESSCNRTRTTQVVVRRSDTLSPKHGKSRP